jgi:hypothetical protein
MVVLDEPEFDRWRAAAETAFRGARAQLDAGLFGWACFMFEQAAQFALKALLHAAGRGERTHDLTRLFKEVSKAGIDLAPELEDKLKRLSRHYPYCLATQTFCPKVSRLVSTRAPTRIRLGRMHRP